MPKFHIFDPANHARSGWHDLYGTSDDALNGNISMFYLVDVSQDMPTSNLQQIEDYTCCPASMSALLNKSSYYACLEWLKKNGLISDDGTEHEGPPLFFSSEGYSCEWDMKYYDGIMDCDGFKKLCRHLKAGKKAIILFHAVRNKWWTGGGHYCVADGYDDGGTGDDTYMFEVKPFKKGTVGNHVLLVQRLLYAAGCNGKDGKPLKLDGEAGTNVEYAIKEYQRRINVLCGAGSLAETGEADKATLESLIGV